VVEDIPREERYAASSSGDIIDCSQRYCCTLESSAGVMDVGERDQVWNSSSGVGGLEEGTENPREDSSLAEGEGWIVRAGERRPFCTFRVRSSMERRRGG
jgi:hypothetical protein